MVFIAQSEPAGTFLADLVDSLDTIFSRYNEYIGEYLILILLIPTGLYFAVRFRFIHVTRFWHAVKAISGVYDREEDQGDINHFRALTTALSGTVGTGNIVGVALAIYYGGPGAVFWMWVTGFLGMVLKLVECTLSFKFRKVNEDGTMSGGPMYYMEFGLQEKLGSFAKVLAVLFAGGTVLSSMGQGNMAQSNSIADILSLNYGIDPWLSGLVIASLVLLVIVGGIRRIAEVTSKLVPFMAILYFISAITVIVIFAEQIPEALETIVRDAFTGTAAVGGFAGVAFLQGLRNGVKRGLFSNEAGQGSAAIAHAAAKTEHPLREGLVASIGPFIDTLIICTLTALVIILSGSWYGGVEGDVEKGVAMTVQGFAAGLGTIGLSDAAQHIVAASLVLFAFSTIISWSYYGSRAAQYLFGTKYIKPYLYAFGLFVFLGSIGKIDVVWNFVDMAITFMTIPNLIAIVLLSSVVYREIKTYFAHPRV